MIAALIATVLLNVQKCGIDVVVEAESARVDPSASTLLTVTITSPKGVTVTPPQLRARFEGFSQAEENAEEPETGPDGTVVQSVQWWLVPEPCAEVYRLAPFVVAFTAAGKEDAFWAGPVYFESPLAREPVTGGMEIDPKKVLPPLSWRLVGHCALMLLAAAGALTALFFGVRYLLRRLKEHRMSPIERAWVELERLLKKGLPGRGRYKDFYVELTMVVRRYIQRRYGIRAPHMTTEEFLRAAAPSDELRAFLESADMVKFAGVQATPEMADDATLRARAYLKGDAALATRKGGVRA